MPSNAVGKAPAASGTPFIMPDGRPLGAFLLDQTNLGLLKAEHRHSKRRSGARRRAVAAGWTGGSKAGVAPLPPLRALTEAEVLERQALERVGQRRQRRYLNDKLLRDMVGPLSAADMSALFKPAPFGESGHVSAFTQAAAPEHAALWELFRSVDMDKEGRVLQKWEAYVRELRGEAAGGNEVGGGAAESPAAAALAAWSAVAPRARRALRHASPQHVEAVEGAILEYLDTTACTPPSPGQQQAGDAPPPAQPELLLRPEDAFGRLVGHGLAQFHALASHSRPDGVGGKCVALRQRAPGGTGAPSITCADVLALLREGSVGAGRGLSSTALREAFCQAGGEEGGLAHLVPVCA